MRALFRIVFLPLVLGLSGFGQDSLSVSLSNGVQVTVTARTAAPGQSVPLATELASASGNSFYRIFRDTNGLTVFGYELSVERTSSGELFRIVAKPAGVEFAVRFPNADGGKPVPTLSSPQESPLLGSGGRFEVEIPTDPGLNVTLTDRVELRLHRPGADGTTERTPAPEGARLRFTGLKVFVNRQRISPPGPATSVAGRYAMFYLPGRGGYFFSTEEAPGRNFVKAGWVDRARMQFTLDNEVFDCSAETPILLTEGRGEIWVYHDPHYQPSGAWTDSSFGGGPPGRQFFMAASDSLSWWLR